MQVERLLSGVEWFAGLDAASQSELARRAVVRRLTPGEILFAEGEDGRVFYILGSGAVRLLKTSPDGREVTVRLLQTGEMFAEVILFESDRYPVTAVAVTAAEVVGIDRSVVHGLLEREGFRREFIAALLRKQRYLAERIIYLTVYEVEERFLRFLQDRFGRRDRYHLRLSKKDVAAAIGATPETLSRLLLRLKGEGVLTWGGDVLEVSPAIWDRLLDSADL